MNKKLKDKNCYDKLLITSVMNGIKLLFRLSEIQAG